jgi:hypothetical protein
MASLFVAYGLVGTLLLLILATRRISPALKLIAVFILVGVTLIGTYIAQPPVTLDGNEKWYSSTPYREALLFLLMLCGMAARYLSRTIEDRRIKVIAAAKTGDHKRVGLDFDLWEFVYPMLVSVISFGALLNQLESDRLTLASVIMSFQTGFFWQTILSRTEQSIASQAR